MSKYIDAEKLKAHIQLLIKKDNYELFDVPELLSFIDSLQQEQPKVDLEQEISSYFKGWTETDEGIACHYQYVNLNTCHAIARHFYELGFNARKEE